MSAPKRHVFVCSQQRPPTHPKGCCAAQGSSQVLQAFWAELQKRQCYDDVAITYSGCLGPCDQGVNVLVYPEAVLYNKVAAADVLEIFDKHLVGGEPVERLQASAAVW